MDHKSSTIVGGLGGILSLIGIILVAVGSQKNCSINHNEILPDTPEGLAFRSAVEVFANTIAPTMKTFMFPAAAGDFYPLPPPDNYPYNDDDSSISSAPLIANATFTTDIPINFTGNTKGITEIPTDAGDDAAGGTVSSPYSAIANITFPSTWWNNPPMNVINFNISNSVLSGSNANNDGAGGETDGSSSSSSFVLTDVAWQKNTLVDVKCSISVNVSSSASSASSAIWSCGSRAEMKSICVELYKNQMLMGGGGATDGKNGDSSSSSDSYAEQAIWYAPWSTTFPCEGGDGTTVGTQPTCGQCSWNSYLTGIAVVVENTHDTANLINGDDEKSGGVKASAASSSSLVSSAPTTPLYALSKTVLSPFYPFNDAQQRFIYTAGLQPLTVPSAASSFSNFVISIYMNKDPFIVAQNVTNGTMRFPYPNHHNETATNGPQQQQGRGDTTNNNNKKKAAGAIISSSQQKEEDTEDCAARNGLRTSGILLIVVGVLLAAAVIFLKISQFLKAKKQSDAGGDHNSRRYEEESMVNDSNKNVADIEQRLNN